MDRPDSAPQILLAHPETTRLEALSTELLRTGHHCVHEASAPAAWHRIRRGRPDAVLMAAGLPGMALRELIARVRGISTTAIIAEVTHRDVRSAVAALRQGADDVVQRSESPETVAQRVRELLASRRPDTAEAVIEARHPGRGASLVELRRRLVALSDLRVPVLLRGEPGSGRSYAAHTIALAARSAQEPLLVLGDRFPSSSILEGRQRCVAYLGELERLDRRQQARWCDVLDSDACRSGALRLIAATRGDLERSTGPEPVDPQLLARISRFVVDVPPLRSCTGDLVAIVDRIAASVGRRLGRSRIVFTPTALRAMQRQPWPGNVAQLVRFVEQWIVFSRDGHVTRRDVESLLDDAPSTVASLRKASDLRRRQELMEAIEAAEGNLAEVARRLGMSRGAIIYRAQKFGLLPERVAPRGGSRRPGRAG